MLRPLYRRRHRGKPEDDRGRRLPGSRQTPAMNMLDLLQWPAMAVTVLAAWLVASDKKSRRGHGFWIFLLSNAMWVAWGWHAHAYALIVLQVCLAAMNIPRRAQAEPRARALRRRRLCRVIHAVTHAPRSRPGPIRRSHVASRSCPTAPPAAQVKWHQAPRRTTMNHRPDAASSLPTSRALHGALASRGFEIDDFELERPRRRIRAAARRRRPQSALPFDRRGASLRHRRRLGLVRLVPHGSRQGDISPLPRAGRIRPIGRRSGSCRRP